MMNWRAISSDAPFLARPIVARDSTLERLLCYPKEPADSKNRGRRRRRGAVEDLSDCLTIVMAPAGAPRISDRYCAPKNDWHGGCCSRVIPPRGGERRCALSVRGANRRAARDSSALVSRSKTPARRMASAVGISKRSSRCFPHDPFRRPDGSSSPRRTTREPTATLWR